MQITACTIASPASKRIIYSTDYCAGESEARVHTKSKQEVSQAHTRMKVLKFISTKTRELVAYSIFSHAMKRRMNNIYTIKIMINWYCS
jgi:hypothetical protein